MKLLVADDDRVARKVLRAFLTDAGYEVAAAEDGMEAIEAMTAEGAPHILILDWVMPGMSGPEVCARLRAASLKIRPYVLMLSSKTDKNEVVAGLDAGADDFLSKPFNLAELLARVRVAQRMVEYEIALHHKFTELEALEQRHRLLGELIALPGETHATAAPGPATAPAATQTSLALAQLPSMACAALEQLGIGEVLPAEAPPDFRPHRVAYAAWVALVSLEDRRWIDLLIEGEPAVVSTFLAQTLHRRSNSNLPKQAFLAEALTIVGSALRADLRQRGCQTLMPFLSQGLYVERARMRLPLPEDSHPVHLRLAGNPLLLTAVDHHATVQRKSSTQLRPFDVLAEAYPPPTVNEVPLLNRGAIISERYIEKLTCFAEATSEQYPIPVFHPSPLALFFNRGGQS